MDKEKIAAGIAWVRKVIAGEATAEDMPSSDGLEVFVAFLERGERCMIADMQRDPQTKLPESIEVVLKNPIEKVAGGGEIVKAVIFRTPSYKELKTIGGIAKTKGEAAAQDTVLTLLAEGDLTLPDFDRMKAIDVQRCAAALMPFLALETE